MPVRESIFSRTDLLQALTASGLHSGDTVLIQLSLGNLGQIEGAASILDACEEALFALLEVLGPEGTFLVPAFTLSFDRSKVFDVATSPSLAGPWSETAEFLELVRRHPRAVRSSDPLYSFTGIGPFADQLLSNLSNSSFGRGGTYERILHSKAKLCLIGVEVQHAVLIDVAEVAASVPWQYKKLFTGTIRQNGATRKQGWIASVPNRALSATAAVIRKHVAVRAQASARKIAIGSGEMITADLGEFYSVLETELRQAVEAHRIGPDTPGAKGSIELPPSSTMSQTISALWRLPRDIVSDGYDTALRALATQLPIEIHQYPTGTECWTWLIPEKWTCHEARLETIDGRILFSYSDNPLHAVSYSLPVDKVVTRQELFQHLHTHPRLDDAIPFIFKYYERDWGLCCSKNLKDSLTDESYRVVIDSEFSFGSLKVGECIVQGSSDETFILCAHLCHPAMVNDDLTGVVVGIQVMQELLKRPSLRYTYRFLILPETIGSVAYLSHNEQLVPKMVGGLFLEMLGLSYPHALQLSFDGATEVDRCLSRILTESDANAWTGAFRTVVGNDERQFNAPGVRVPMLSLSRVMRGTSDGWPYYPEYHSSHDTPELASESRLAESRDLVLRMIDSFEANEVPVNLYHGEVFCSRFGLNIDAYANPEGNRALFDILFLIDGTRSLEEIARICGVSRESVRLVVEELRERGLVAYAPLPRA